MTYQESIDPMARQMICKLLSKKDEKTSWKYESIGTLLGLLKQEVDEAEAAFENCNPTEVMAEIVDIANFCMMIHDNLTRRSIMEVSDE